MANSKPYWSIVLSSKNLCENNWLRYQLYPSLYFPLGHCLYFALQSILFKGMDEGLSKVWLISLGIVSLLLIVACVQPVLSAINNILDSDKVYIQRKIKNDVFIQEEENEVYFQEEMSLIDFCSDNSGLSSLAGKRTAYYFASNLAILKKDMLENTSLVGVLKEGLLKALLLFGGPLIHLSSAANIWICRQTLEGYREQPFPLRSFDQAKTNWLFLPSSYFI